MVGTYNCLKCVFKKSKGIKISSPFSSKSKGYIYAYLLYTSNAERNIKSRYTPIARIFCWHSDVLGLPLNSSGLAAPDWSIRRSRAPASGLPLTSRQASRASIDASGCSPRVARAAIVAAWLHQLVQHRTGRSCLRVKTASA